jgi:mRNA-degrading endonuclease RelE of RelBE toxin-antitoxin system
MSSTDRYTVELTRQAEKDLKDLRPWTRQATAEILRLEVEPRRGHTLSGSLRGARSLEFTHKGSGAYRAVYTILDESRLCLVFIIGLHENIYDKAQRRYDALRRAGDI